MGVLNGTLRSEAHPVTVRTTIGGVAVSSTGASLILRDPVSGASARLAPISPGQAQPHRHRAGHLRDDVVRVDRARHGDAPQ